MVKPSTSEKRVIIVGAGVAGIATAIALKTQLGFENFTIYEKADRPGGTWRDSTYPGCGSDVGGHWYSLSSELNPNWSAYYASQPEILAYWDALFVKHQLAARTIFRTDVVNAEWDVERQVWRVETVTREATGAKGQEEERRDVVEAEVLFYAIGGFMAPMYPREVKGRAVFRGEQWHSACWRHDVDLAGKRVGVIGNGCSAAQIVPQLAKDPSTTVLNFVRTPQWYVPQNNVRYPALVKWVFAHIPGVLRAYRSSVMARSDLVHLIFNQENKLVTKTARWLLSKYIRDTAPKEYAEKLVPDYAVGCKRIIVDPGFLKSLHRENVALTWDAIDSVVEEGIKLKTREVVPLDVIVYATGYSLDAPDLRVTGSQGKTMREYHVGQGGATAYFGCSMPGFPNLFMLLGPNVATGHASVIFSEEVQIQLALQVIKPVLDGDAQSFEIKDEVVNKYNEWLQARLRHSVWTDCMSYYRVDRSQGKIVATFPGPVTLFWRLARRPRWDEWKGVGAEAWARRLQEARRRRRYKVVLVLVAAALAGWLKHRGV
ncbi:hypothetical protein BD626DRAFT_403629 [Schizophyllum amplum]|uniref:L-ornithine N(5)-monooxygenase [NAD(P)H] n=1 Tax=Schizophyllum amplum TaxID=97359 RepID=A0A550CCS7_9AGAR|nr:hypothetical protein BD626DRAFT_403629 [Auriculariopsis ampla]